MEMRFLVLLIIATPELLHVVVEISQTMKTKIKRSIALPLFLAVAFGLAAPKAEAAILRFTGSFFTEGDGFPDGGGTPAIPAVSGAFSFLFDDSLITGAGEEEFDNIPLESLTLNPNPLGTTTFSTANSVAFLRFSGGLSGGGGLLDGLAVGGAPMGAFGQAPGVDDWLVAMVSSDPPIPPGEAWVVVPGVSWDRSMTHFTFDIKRVPEPSLGIASVLAFVGIFGISGVKALRKRSKV